MNTQELFQATLEDLDVAPEPYPPTRTFDIYRRFDGASVGAAPMNSTIYVAQCMNRLSAANRSGALAAMPQDSVGGLAALPASVGGDYLYTPPYNADTNSYEKAYALGNVPYAYNPTLNIYQGMQGVAGQDFVGTAAFTSEEDALATANENLLDAQNRLAAANQAMADNTDPDAVPGLVMAQTNALAAVAAASQAQQALAAQAGSDFGASINPFGDQPPAPSPAPLPVPVNPPRVSPPPAPAPAPAVVAKKKGLPWGTILIGAAAAGAVVFHKDLGF